MSTETEVCLQTSCANCLSVIPSFFRWGWCVAFKHLLLDQKKDKGGCCSTACCSTACFLCCCYGSAYSTWWTMLVNKRENTFPMAEVCWDSGRCHGCCQGCCEWCYICSMLQFTHRDCAERELSNEEIKTKLTKQQYTDALNKVLAEKKDPCSEIVTCNQHMCFRYTSCCIVHSLVKDTYKFPEESYCLCCYCWCQSIYEAKKSFPTENKSDNDHCTPYCCKRWFCPCCVTSDILKKHIKRKLEECEEEEDYDNTRLLVGLNTTPSESNWKL